MTKSRTNEKTIRQIQRRKLNKECFFSFSDDIQGKKKQQPKFTQRKEQFQMVLIKIEKRKREKQRQQNNRNMETTNTREMIMNLSSLFSEHTFDDAKDESWLS